MEAGLRRAMRESGERIAAGRCRAAAAALALTGKISDAG
ncbi:hypothetical protein SDC9_103013 [bioreactor metagenome]|uniref:Uncharacterized protein n=1 Tax=bioreactor metagenome TaxID=1076179 RepID=A0A645AV83_9ZZZZ